MFKFPERKRPELHGKKFPVKINDPESVRKFVQENPNTVIVLCYHGVGQSKSQVEALRTQSNREDICYTNGGVASFVVTFDKNQAIQALKEIAKAKIVWLIHTERIDVSFEGKTIADLLQQWTKENGNTFIEGTAGENNEGSLVTALKAINNLPQT